MHLYISYYSFSNFCYRKQAPPSSTPMSEDCASVHAKLRDYLSNFVNKFMSRRPGLRPFRQPGDLSIASIFDLGVTSEHVKTQLPGYITSSRFDSIGFDSDAAHHSTKDGNG